MSIYYGISRDSVGTLFSSLGTSSGTGSILADYYSIKNGSYKKLLTAYYSMDENTAFGSKAATSTSVSEDSTKTLLSIESSADALKESADTLIKTGSKSVFKKQSDGTYDVNGIYDKVKDFVLDYNSVIESTEESNTKNIASTSASMITTVKTNESLLEKIGISVNSDGTLKLSEDAFKKSDMSAVESLFNGNGSFGYQISAKASMIDFYADKEAGKSNTYTSSGLYSYNYSAGDILNKLY